MKPRIVPLLLLLAFAACGASRAEIISRTSVGIVAARAGFNAAEEEHQMALVEAATSKAEAEAAVAAFRKWRNAGTTAYKVACGALAAAALDPSDLNMRRLAELAALAVAALNPGGRP